MAGKKPTQAMPSDAASKQPPDPGELATEGNASPQAGSESAGGPYPRPRRPKGAGEDWHGGQSGAAYHGSGQLGEQETKPGGNANSGGRK